MAIRYQDENGNWVTGQKAIETKITDQQGNFESNNVEGALRELAEGVKANADVTKLEATIQANSNKIGNLQTKVTNLQSDMATAQEDIEWLKVNGGGGGGTAVPTITSTFKDTAIDKGSDVTIPIFFSSPNKGNGTAYILVNNVQVDTTGLKQGNNNVRVDGQFLTSQTENLVAIYAKDRAGIVSNQLSWTIVAGGIELTSTFDYESDYGITDTIRIDYNIDTGINETITLTLDIDNNVTTYTAVNGGNFIDIAAADLGLGTHVVKMHATVGKYTSKTLSFNLVIVSTTELYLSSSFDQTKDYNYGVPISVNYRLSKQSTEEFNVYLKIDDKTVKTQKLTVGSYYWTIQSLSEGTHTLTIQAVSLDYSEDKSITLTVKVVMGEYTPVEDYTSGLICDLNAIGKSNDDDEVLVDNLWKDSSGNGHDAKLVNFNYGTNGFVNDVLVCDNDAYAVIEWSPWERNAITGSTIDIIYEPINSGIEDCRVLDYTQITDDTSTLEIKPFKGLYADVLHGIVSSASSGTSAGKINIDDESGEIHLTWVLDRTNKFMKTYINGVLSRIMFLSDSGSGVNKVYEDFSLSSNIYLNSTKGENCGTNNIKRFRVYDHALTSDQVLQNHLANIKDLTKQEEEYNFNYNNTTLPKMYLTGDTTNMTATQTVPMKIEYVSPNEEKYGQSFNTGIQNNPVCIQGTSSLQYVRHNYTIYLKDEYGADMLYNPYGSGSKPENVFCLKADYVESSHANNTGIAKFINDCVYDTKTPMQLADSDCRTTINGFPIEVYVNGEYLGVYNFNHDRYSYKSYGYDYNKYPNMLVYEINSNSNTSAGAFYRYGDNAESSANVSELEYYKRDFNLIYGNRTTDSDSYSEIKTLVEWVSVAEQDLFREMISEHFNKEYLFRYLLTVLMIGAVDSLGKNMKIMTIDGQVWYPTFYDLDTVLGIDNSGYLTIEPDVEIESGSYNTSNSNLWSKVWNYFNTELKEEWAKMRQGSFTLDNLMKYIYGEQISKIPAKMYNDDAQVKYLDFGSLYTYCCHGSKEHQIRRWLRERIAYVDSMLGYFTSQEDQVTIRMNKTGSVSFDVTPYIPLYFSVKWSNATGGTQTFKLKRGETKTFNYSSTTSTDQEVIIYHAKYIKRLDNLSNLNPSSCILSNAVKLTNVEIHSSELYNINVTNNKFLRSINLENCTALGTVTATGSSLNLSNCKYLRYCNVYNTHLTEVQLNTSGGSLTEIYYPKSIQSINLVKQRLLELVGLPYGEKGSEIPTSLYTISIQECPSITKLNTSSDTTIASSFASMVYVNNLTIRNSLDLASLKFDGFHRLQNVTIENMYNLEEVGFNNLLPVGETSTIKYIGMSNCPKLGTIELNCTSNDYEITFADDAILNFGGLFKLNSITSNCVLKGIKTIVVPINLESMFFTNEYGSGYSTIENIWVSSQCNVDTQATTPIVTHVDSTYSGIDFLGMNLKNIDLGALVNIPKAINFKLSPTTVNPHFNLNRDGETYKYLQPVGTLDLSNYTESLAKFFDGVDLDKLEIICNNNLPQTDLSYCFYNSSFSTNEAINKLLTKVSSITNLDYCFYKTTIDSVDILDEINMGASSSMNYTFAECPNIKTLNNVVIPSKVTSVEGMFNKCPLTTITNMVVNVRGSISGLFKGCNKLTTITTLRIPNVTDVSNTFDGCTSLSSLSGFELPSSCTNVSNLFNGCYMLTELGMEFGANITAGDNWYPPNLETLHDTTISNDYVKLTNCTTLKTLNNVNISGGDLSDLFNGCINLANINRCTFNATTSLARAFKGCSKITINPITTIVDTVTDISEIYNGCTGITDISGMTFGSGISYGGTSSSDWYPPNLTTANNVTIKCEDIWFNGCSTLVQCRNLNLQGVTNLNYYFANCSNVTEITFNPNSQFSKIKSMGSCFSNCSKLSNVDVSIIPKTNTSTLLGCFSRCSSLTSITLDIPDTCTNIQGLFQMSGVNDISGSTFGNGITNATNWKPPGLTIADNVTIKAIDTTGTSNVNFSGCNALMSAKNLKLVPFGNSDKFIGQDMFKDCTSLEYVNLIECPKFSYSQSMFQGTKVGKNSNGVLNIKNDLGIPNSCINGGINASAMFFDCTYLAEVEFEDSELVSVFAQTMFQGCTNLKKISNFKPKSISNFFRFVKGATDVELNNCYIPAKFETDGCEGITKLINCTILDSVTNMDNFFTPATGLYDISGLTIGSGVTSATDWIANCPITTANNITMKNDNTKFTDCSTLVSCTNFKITSDVTELSETFKNCSNLTSFSFSNESDFSNLIEMLETFKNDNSLVALNLSNIVCTSKLVSMNELCGNCSSLTALYLPSNLQDSSITVLNGVAPSCRKLKTVYNLYLPDGFVEFGNYAFGWVGTIELKDTIDVIGFRVPNTTDPSKVFAKVYKMFKSFSNVIWSETATSIAGMFQGLIHLTHDLEIPSHITDCSNAFKGCTSMTHVHSNWNNTYTNGITSTDCYAGCTGITHIDDENVIAYEGDSGIDYIPKDWGGYGFDVDHSSIYEITTTADNTEVRLLYYHYQFVYSVDGVYYNSENSISWGDGEYHTVPNSSTDSDGTVRPGIFGSTSFPAHTYAKAGTYYMKGNFIPKTYGNGPGAPYVTRVLRVAKKCVNTSRSTGIRTETPIENMEKYFENLTNVTYINATNLITSTTKKVVNMFKNCQKLVTIDGMNTWDCSNIVNVSGMFYLCKSLTQLDLNMFNYSIIDDFINFLNACSSLTNLDFSNFKINTISSCDGIFYGLGMSELTLDNSGVDKYVNLYRSMNFLPNATSVTLKNFKLSSLKQQFYAGCTKLTSVSYINCTMSDTCDVNEYTFNNLPIVNFDFTGTEITVDLLLNRNSAISHESLVNIITNLKDYSSGDTHTLTIGSTNLAKLTTDEITIATNKNWTVV